MREGKALQGLWRYIWMDGWITRKTTNASLPRAQFTINSNLLFLMVGEEVQAKLKSLTAALGGGDHH